MPFRQPGRGNAASEVLFKAEDVRPVERQLRFFLFEETPRQAHVPHLLVVRAFADIRPIAEGIGGIAPQLDATGQVGVGVQPEAVIAGVIAGSTQAVGGVAETPVARQLKASPLGLVAHAQVGIQRTVAGNAAVGLLPLPLIYKAHALGKQGTCTRRYVETPLETLLVPQVGTAIPVTVDVCRVTLPAARHGVVGDCTCYIPVGGIRLIKDLCIKSCAYY